ncbi:zf-HC2 domain-containing protein [Yinghuangia sp. ASG 101]|uniref:anti-sigma factor n=1 Tax=Yinghuangia sp. ASG 101 TaxID=2896848 RepID=UPI001E378654|nr:zf-HC2 domain-containing protein [Yinghuangia sp. ASG 101]UGQ14913.1 zf-HC2 domain-containing protein [Yinghuangia sp. ASG 101]
MTGVNGPGVPDDPRPAAGTPDAEGEPYAFPRPTASEAGERGFRTGADAPRADEQPGGWVPFAPSAAEDPTDPEGAADAAEAAPPAGPDRRAAEPAPARPAYPAPLARAADRTDPADPERPPHPASPARAVEPERPTHPAAPWRPADHADRPDPARPAHPAPPAEAEAAADPGRVPPRPRQAPPAPEATASPTPAAPPEPRPEPPVPVRDAEDDEDPGRQVCEALRLDLGAYVLGALDETETHWIRSHVATCPECRAEYDELAELPPFLARLTPAEAEASGVAREERPENLFAAAAERVRRDRRTRTTVLASAAAFAVLVGTFGWVMGTQDDSTPSARPTASAPPASPTATAPPPPPPADQRTATAAGASGAEMSLVYRAVAWGTAIDLQLAGIPGGTRCQLDVYGTRGRQETASSWVVPKDGYQKPGSVHVPGGTSIPPDEITRFVVSTVGDENELLVAKTVENATTAP